MLMEKYRYIFQLILINNIMTEEEKEDYLYEYVDAFIEALYDNSGEHEFALLYLLTFKIK